jgi:hypothetical protein
MPPSFDCNLMLKNQPKNVLAPIQCLITVAFKKKKIAYYIQINPSN